MIFFGIRCAEVNAPPREYNLKVGGYKSLENALRQVVRNREGYVMDSQRRIVMIVRKGVVIYDMRSAYGYE